MPNQTFGPSSTPQLYLENQYRLLQSQAADWEKNLQSQGLDEQSYAEAIQNMQEQLNEQVSQFQAKADQLRQTRGMTDAGLMDEQAATRANWEAILPDEVLRAMYPKPEDEPDRGRLSMNTLDKITGSIEEFGTQIPKTTVEKRYGKSLGVTADWLKRDVKGYAQADVMKMYLKWRTMIGYDGLESPIERKQVDQEWDDWIASQKGTWKWNPDSKLIKAYRARGPLTRAYGSQFRQTPTGPNEATNPLSDSIAQALPKKKNQPTAEELLQDRTEENYELGKSLGYWK